MTEKEVFKLFGLYGTDMGDYYEIEVGRIERLVKEIEFESAPKNLTDEEIIELGGQFFNQQDWDAIGFYRAILRKAQE